MLLRRKKKLLRKAIEEEAELIEELHKDYKDQDLSPDEYVRIEKRWHNLVPVLRSLLPPPPLKPKEVLARLGFGAVLFAMFLGGAGIFIKVKYFPSDITLFSESDESSGKYKHVPEQLGAVADLPTVLAQARSDIQHVDRFESLKGEVVGLFPIENSQIAIIYTREEDNNSFSLYRRAFDLNLNFETAGEEKIPISGDIVDASVLKAKDGYVVAYFLGDPENRNSIWIQELDKSFGLRKEPKELRFADPLESSIGLSLSYSYEGPDRSELNYYLVTAKAYDRKKESVLDTTVPIVRKMDTSFNVIKSEVLGTSHLSLDINMAINPNREDGGFYIIANGRDPLDKGDMKKGDELYVLEYNKEWDLENIVRVTNSGVAHNFWPSQVVAEGNVWLVPYQRAQQPWSGEGNGYPEDAGKVFVMALEGLDNVTGTFFAADYNVRRPGGDRLEGGRNTHIAKLGTRLFIAHDGMIEEDVFDEGEGGDGRYRILRIQWIETNLQEAQENELATLAAGIASRHEEPAKENSRLEVLATPTGWLRVRSGPSLDNKEIAKINGGDVFEYTEEQSGWYKIILSEGLEGWIWGQYVKKM